MTRTTHLPLERELYPPLRDWLRAQGYTVRAEVQGCDITARRGGELVVIELKRRFNAGLLMQATDRQRAADSVYVALPIEEASRGRAHWKGMIRVLKRLELGLILVAPNRGAAGVRIEIHPAPVQRRRQPARRRAILEEMAGRSGDYNTGGAARRPIVTAYREEALYIACCLERGGPLATRVIRELGGGPRTQPILYGNVYGWFERVERGVYQLTRKGRAELECYPELVQRFRGELSKKKLEGERNANAG